MRVTERTSRELISAHDEEGSMLCKRKQIQAGVTRRQDLERAQTAALDDRETIFPPCEMPEMKDGTAPRHTHADKAVHKLAGGHLAETIF